MKDVEPILGGLFDRQMGAALSTLKAHKLATTELAKNVMKTTALPARKRIVAADPSEVAIRGIALAIFTRGGVRGSRPKAVRRDARFR